VVLMKGANGFRTMFYLHEAGEMLRERQARWYKPSTWLPRPADPDKMDPAEQMDLVIAYAKLVVANRTARKVGASPGPGTLAALSAIGGLALLSSGLDFALAVIMIFGIMLPFASAGFTIKRPNRIKGTNELTLVFGGNLLLAAGTLLLAAAAGAPALLTFFAALASALVILDLFAALVFSPARELQVISGGASLALSAGSLLAAIFSASTSGGLAWLAFGLFLAYGTHAAAQFIARDRTPHASHRQHRLRR